MAATHIPFAAGADRQIRAAVVTAARVDDTVGADSRWNRRLAVAVREPDELPGLRVICVDARARVDDQLVTLSNGHQQRGTVPAQPGPAIGLPQRFAGLPVEG